MARTHPDELRFVTGHGKQSATDPDMMADCIEKTISWLVYEAFQDNQLEGHGKAVQWLNFADTENAAHFKHAVA